MSSPFVAMKAQLYDYDPGAPDGAGAATLDSSNNPIIGFGTAPIDIPNCERCHSNPADGNLITIPPSESAGIPDEDPGTPGVQMTIANSPNDDPAQYALVQGEYNFWAAFFGIDKLSGDSDWYPRLKSAAISILVGHDSQHGTSFTANYPTCATVEECGAHPYATRLGHDSVICQRCHADNVIAVVKSANCGPDNELGSEPCLAGTLIRPISEAVHRNHGGVSNEDSNFGNIVFTDSHGRDGACQGCHPAHRADGDMQNYPLTLAGTNRQALADNRDSSGGCFVGRDVHSNPGKDSDGAETPEHLNAVGQWLANNVSNDPTENKGIWCTNCHTQLSQEIWKAENMVDLVNGIPGKQADGVTDAVNVRAEPSLAAIAAAIGTTEDQAIAWLDPNNTNLHGTGLGDFSRAIWAPDPGLGDYVSGYLGLTPVNPAQDGNVATVEVNLTSAAACSTGGGSGVVSCGGGVPDFYICGSTDVDGDFNVSLLDFCTTPDCVVTAAVGLPGDSLAVPVPFSAATDGRDHWLAAGEPHCADCHAAPYVEQSGNINQYPPFNYPRKASLMRYSKGHQNISCQGCHESIHGLYPVTPNIDTTTYAQAAALNHDGSHGPLKCGTCHEVGGDEIPTFLNTAGGNIYGITDYDSAVGWAHTYTAEANVLNTTCQNCHGVNGYGGPGFNPNSVPADWTLVAVPGSPDASEPYLGHAHDGRTSRLMMDNAEMLVNGAPLDTTDGSDGVCTGCHVDATSWISTCTTPWKNHLVEGRVTEKAWETASIAITGDTCGW